MVDNYDSFTYNLVQYFEELGVDVQVVRNDEVTIDDIESRSPEQIVISPGPCIPDKAGISMAVVRQFAGKIPILGVCLGHQSIAQVFGGKIIHAEKVMHGKTSSIYHKNIGVFSNLLNPFKATRYHSFVVESSSLPNCFEVTAWVEKSNGKRGEIMGIRHKTLSVEGVQFHPESILTQQGRKLLKNFITHT